MHKSFYSLLIALLMTKLNIVYNVYVLGRLMSHSPHSQAVTLSVRIQPKAREQLEELASATGRTKSFLAAEAIEIYLLTQQWQATEIKKSLKKANSKKAIFIAHEKVSSWLNSWGEENEEDPPRE